MDNEASPYAFDDPEPTASSSVPSYSRKSASSSSSAGVQAKPEKKPKKKDKPAAGPESSSGAASSSAAAMAADSNIPIPEELAKQLKAQAKKEASSSGTSETTYFIPLQSGGSSFGVSVKLSTEGPPGPNQKVIMTAKLVTQPTGKPIGAKVIGAKALETGASKASAAAAAAAKSGSKKFSRMPMASPASPPSSDDNSSADDDTDSSDSSMTSPKSKRSRKGRRDADDEHQYPESCLGPVEVLERFPKLGQHAKLVEAPVFRPSEKEFRDDKVVRGSFRYAKFRSYHGSDNQISNLLFRKLRSVRQK